MTLLTFIPTEIIMRIVFALFTRFFDISSENPSLAFCHIRWFIESVKGTMKGIIDEIFRYANLSVDLDK